jgi:hypothetical protein
MSCCRAIGPDYIKLTPARLVLVRHCPAVPRCQPARGLLATQLFVLYYRVLSIYPSALAVQSLRQSDNARRPIDTGHDSSALIILEPWSNTPT